MPERITMSGGRKENVTAEVLSVGTELLLGQIVDTNAAYISTILPDWGISIYRRTTVGDNLERIIDALREAFSRADIVITTGGLGPTMDDLTREAIAGLWGLEMKEDPRIIRRLEAFFKDRRYPMAKSNRKQALCPEGGILIDNAVGTAPGIFIERNDRVFIALPGPPFEMKPMLPRVYDLLCQRGYAGCQVIRSRVIHTCGIGESSLEEKLDSIIRHQNNPTIAPLAHPAGVDLRLTAKAETAEKAEAMLSEVESRLQGVIGEAVYGTDQESLEGAVVRLLQERKMKLALAESCTGGLVAHLITNIPGISVNFPGGIISYANSAKIELLGVDEALIRNYGAVSPECAGAMAAGVRKAFHADIGLSLTGIAGPSGGTAEKPVGLLYTGLSTTDGQVVKKARFKGGREENKLRFARTALDMLRRYLLAEEL